MSCICAICFCQVWIGSDKSWRSSTCSNIDVLSNIWYSSEKRWHHGRHSDVIMDLTFSAFERFVSENCHAKFGGKLDNKSRRNKERGTILAILLLIPFSWSNFDGWFILFVQNCRLLHMLKQGKGITWQENLQNFSFSFHKAWTTSFSKVMFLTGYSLCQLPHIPKRHCLLSTSSRKFLKQHGSSHSIGIAVQYWRESQSSFPFETFTCRARVRDYSVFTALSWP